MSDIASCVPIKTAKIDHGIQVVSSIQATEIMNCSKNNLFKGGMDEPVGQIRILTLPIIIFRL